MQAVHRHQLPTSRASTSLCSRSSRPQNSSCASCVQRPVTQKGSEAELQRSTGTCPRESVQLWPAALAAASTAPGHLPCTSNEPHTCWKAPWKAAEWASSARFRLAGVMYVWLLARRERATACSEGGGGHGVDRMGSSACCMQATMHAVCKQLAHDASPSHPWHGPLPALTAPWPPGTPAMQSRRRCC